MEEIRREVDENRTQFDTYRDGVWYHPTGWEVFESGIWWDEYEDGDGNIRLFN